MKTQYFVLSVIVAVLMAGGFFFLSGISQKDKPSQNISTNNAGQQLSQDNESVNGANYIVYSQDNLMKAQEKGSVVLFFWAVWCPTCKALDAQLRLRGNELPSDVTILKANYDTEKELKQKYQITQQHTLVLIDREGKEVTKWIGGGIETLIAQVN